MAGVDQITQHVVAQFQTMLGEQQQQVAQILESADAKYNAQQSIINQQMSEHSQLIKELAAYLQNNPIAGPAVPGPVAAGADPDGGPDGADEAGESRTLKAVIDPKALERAPNFTGKDEDFNHWEFALTGYLGLIGIHEVVEESMRISVKEEEKLLLSNLNQSAKDVSKALWFLLANTVQGKAKTIMQSSEECNGLAALRKIKLEYRPQVGGRLNSMLRNILNPKWTEASFGEQILKWENSIDSYEKQSGEKVSERTKIATIFEAVPAQYKNLIALASVHADQDFKKFRKYVYDNLEITASFTQEGVRSEDPMQVGGLYTPGKGKGGKDGKGQELRCQLCKKRGHTAKTCFSTTKGAGKAPGKFGGKWGPKGADQKGVGKGPGKGPGKGQGTGQGFACYTCGQQGHMSKNCPMKGGSYVGGLEYPNGGEPENQNQNVTPSAYGPAKLNCAGLIMEGTGKKSQSVVVA